jgi:hypothetical protein
MNRLNQILFSDVQRLDDSSLTELLLLLLRLESERHGLNRSSIAVSLNITSSDDGEDGRVKWDGGPANTEWIPDRFTIFQCKATYMSPAKCGTEVCKKDSTDLKPSVKEVLDANGSYVLFYGHECNEKHSKPRIKEIRDAIRKAGETYADSAKISDDWMTKHHLTHVLGDLNDKNIGASLIASFPIEFLRGWCEQNRPNAAHILARITPVIVKTESQMQWHPVAKMLLDNFGDDEEMLSELSANWGTFSWSGSLIPYYEQQLALIQQLANHPTPAVRQWQAQNVEWLTQRIDFERKREEEVRLGVR